MTLLTAAGLLLWTQGLTAQPLAHQDPTVAHVEAPTGMVEPDAPSLNTATPLTSLSRDQQHNNELLPEGFVGDSPERAFLPLHESLLQARPAEAAGVDWLTSQFDLITDVHTAYLRATSVETPDLHLRLDPMNMQWSLRIPLGHAQSAGADSSASD